MKSKVILLVSLILTCCNLPALATWPELSIIPNPQSPTINDLISINIWRDFGDPGQEFVSSSFSITGDNIDIEVIMQDLHSPGVGFFQIPVIDGDIVDIGTLSMGDYTVNANMYMIAWYGGTPSLLDSGTASFSVVPEPTALLLLSLGTLILRRRN